MASTKWLHFRIWCGRLPHFHLLAEPELLAEREFSLLYFGSHELASLRTQIRLKLKETPLINQTRRNAAAYTSILELLNQYLPYDLALNQYLELHGHEENNGKELLAVFPLLFYGFNTVNLRSDRVLCGSNQRTQHALAVDLVLTLFTMAQMHALSLSDAGKTHRRCSNGRRHSRRTR
ncbi:hypothetical protein FI667_g12178, partial [Globisporangium splendens]